MESRESDVVGRQDSLTLGSHLLQAAPRPNAIDGLAKFEPTLWELQHLDCGFDSGDEMGRCVAIQWWCFYEGERRNVGVSDLHRFIQ